MGSTPTTPLSSPLSNCKIHTTRRTFSHLHSTREERKEFLSLPRIISELGLFKRLRFLHAPFTQPRPEVARLESSLNFGVMTPHCRCLLSPFSSKIVAEIGAETQNYPSLHLSVLSGPNGFYTLGEFLNHCFLDVIAKLKKELSNAPTYGETSCVKSGWATSPSVLRILRVIVQLRARFLKYFKVVIPPIPPFQGIPTKGHSQMTSVPTGGRGFGQILIKGREVS